MVWRVEGSTLPCIVQDTLAACACSFVEILLELGFNNGVPIDEAFYNSHISGRHNPDITSDLFPDWSEERRERFADDKEGRFRALAGSCFAHLCSRAPVAVCVGCPHVQIRIHIACTHK